MSWQDLLDNIDIATVILPIRITDLMVELEFCQSRGEAKRLISQGGIQVCCAFKDFPPAIPNMGPIEDWTKLTEDFVLKELPICGLLIRKSRRILFWLQEEH